MEIEELVKNAKKARETSYSPYSKYSVGAALMTKNGKIYTGCNIENHGIMSICAERVAFLKAISEGEKDFEKIVVVAGEHGKEIEKVTPCGYCRQFMSEFVERDFEIYTSDRNGNIERNSIEELLPKSFEI